MEPDISGHKKKEKEKRGRAGHRQQDASSMSTWQERSSKEVEFIRGWIKTARRWGGKGRV